MPSEVQDILPGARIVVTQYVNFSLEGADGPFQSLKELKKNSRIYRDLLQKNPKRAETISKEEFIVKAEKIIVAPNSWPEEYLSIVYHIMQHSSNGTIQRRDVRGIHLFNPEKVRITELLKPENELGLFMAKIEVLNDQTAKWIAKEEATTFFPKDWDKQRLIIECAFAFIHRKEIDLDHFEGRTLSGIKVAFMYDSAKFRTVFPIYE